MCSCPQTTSKLNLHLIVYVHLPNHTLLWACSLSGLWRLAFISPCELALGIMGSRNFALWLTRFWNLQIPSLVFSRYGFEILIVFLVSCYSILLFDLGPGQESSSSELRTPSQIWVHAIAKVPEYLPMLHGYLIF
jgi:hypothetical protein